MLCVFGLPIAGWIVIRVLQHQERMEMIRRGLTPPQPTWRGGTHTAPPPSAPPGYPQPPYAGPGRPAGYAQRQLHRGIMTMAVGVALFIGLSFIGYHRDGSWEPGPWLLGGLIPMAVGFAQFVGAVLSGAEIPGRRQSGPYVAGPTQPPPRSLRAASLRAPIPIVRPEIRKGYLGRNRRSRREKSSGAP